MARHSLTGRSNFSRLYLQGNSWSCGGARIRYIIEGGDFPRFAVSVPKACGNAVVRNKIRRRWRDILRSIESTLPAGSYHILIRGDETAFEYAGAQSILSKFQTHVGK